MSHQWPSYHSLCNYGSYTVREIITSSYNKPQKQELLPTTLNEKNESHKG